MNIAEYDDNDLVDDSYFDTGIAGFEIAYTSESKTAIKKTAKNKLYVKRKLDMLQEKRQLAKATDMFYDEWQH